MEENYWKFLPKSMVTSVLYWEEKNMLPLVWSSHPKWPRTVLVLKLKVPCLGNPLCCKSTRVAGHPVLSLTVWHEELNYGRRCSSTSLITSDTHHWIAFKRGVEMPRGSRYNVSAGMLVIRRLCGANEAEALRLLSISSDFPVLILLFLQGLS